MSRPCIDHAAGNVIGMVSGNVAGNVTGNVDAGDKSRKSGDKSYD